MLVDKWVAAKGGSKSQEASELKIQTELMTITERPTANTNPPSHEKYRKEDYFPATDGFQVRDLSIFEKNSNVFYFPPLSAGNIDFDFRKLVPRWGALIRNPQRWSKLWKRIWAGPIARAKVFALLRYGFQHIAPHGQNLLLELEEGRSIKSLHPEDAIQCKSVVIRDLGDVAIHTDVTDQLWMNDAKIRKVLKFEMPENSEGKWTLNENGVPEPLAETVYKSVHHNTEYGAAQVNLHWTNMSAVVRPIHVEQAQSQKERGMMTQGAYDGDDYTPFWRSVIAVMSECGREHNRVFVECFERQLGVFLPQIDFSDFKSPDEYRSLKITDVNGAKEYQVNDYTAETAVGAVLHAFLKSDRGKQAIMSYRDRSWAGFPHTVEIKVEADQRVVPNALLKIDARQLSADWLWRARKEDVPNDSCPCKCIGDWAKRFKPSIERAFQRDFVGFRWADDEGIIRLYGPKSDQISATSANSENYKISIYDV